MEKKEIIQSKISPANQKLVKAFESVDIELLKEAISEGADINFCPFSAKDWETSLHKTMLGTYMWEKELCLKYIPEYPPKLLEYRERLDKEEKLSEEEREEYDRLWYSVDYSPLEKQVCDFLEVAIENGLKLNKIKRKEHSGYYACIVASPSILKFLFEHGVDIYYIPKKKDGTDGESIIDFLTTEQMIDDFENNQPTGYHFECEEKINFLKNKGAPFFRRGKWHGKK